MSGGVTVQVREGYAVYDGKTQVTSGQVTLDADEADRLALAGAVERFEAKPARTATPRKRA